MVKNKRRNFRRLFYVVLFKSFVDYASSTIFVKTYIAISLLVKVIVPFSKVTV